MPTSCEELLKIALSELEEELKLLMRCGIMYLGYRQFKKDGSTLGFCNHPNWRKVMMFPGIQEDMREHYAKELVNISRHSEKYVIRYESLPKSCFLHRLYGAKIGNSLVVYKKKKDSIDGIFFIAEEYNFDALNVFFCSRDLLSHVAQKIGKKIEGILKTRSFDDLYQPLFKELEVSRLFKSKIETPKERLRQLNSYLAAGESLTEREIETLIELANGSSLKEIGEKLYVCKRAVVARIMGVKRKLKTESKEQIQQLALEVKKICLEH